MLKKNLIVLAALTILAMTVMPAIADEPWQDTDSLKKKVDEMLRLKAHGWPVSFEWVDLEGFVVPVYMDVGLFLEILNMGEVVDEGIVLEQVGIDKYEGCSLPFKIKCNFALKLGCKVEPTEAGYDMMRKKYDPTKDPEDQQELDDKVSNFWDCEIRDVTCDDELDEVSPTYCENIKERTIWVEFDDATIVHAPFGKNIHVADVQVRVKPDLKEQWVIDP